VEPKGRGYDSEKSGLLPGENRLQAAQQEGTGERILLARFADSRAQVQDLKRGVRLRPDIPVVVLKRFHQRLPDR
jgi:hypothetical protein